MDAMRFAGWVMLGLAGAALAYPVGAGEGTTALAEAVQNPVADLISVPFRNNTNFNYGPYEDTQNVLNMQPVIPISLDPEWNLITRAIAPVITQAGVVPGQDSTTGLGDIEFTAFQPPAKPHGLIWGVDPIVQLPMSNSDRRGSDTWGLGPSAVALRMEGPPVMGALVNNVWSVRRGSDPSYNNLLLQPFVNYNFPQHPGRYLTFSPIITADWKTEWRMLDGAAGPGHRPDRQAREAAAQPPGLRVLQRREARVRPRLAASIPSRAAVPEVSACCAVA
jgi:hypothetical protein